MNIRSRLPNLERCCSWDLSQSKQVCQPFDRNFQWMKLPYNFVFKQVNGARNLRFEVFTAVTIKNFVFWDVSPCGSCKFTDSCHPDEGGAKFLRNVGSYKSHTALHPRRHHSSVFQMFKQKGNIPNISYSHALSNSQCLCCGRFHDAIHSRHCTAPTSLHG
jgi:hypothetical protein